MHSQLLYLSKTYCSFQYFKEVVQRNFVAMQPADKQPLLSKCFENLMNEVEPNLLGKNRDR